MKVEPGGYGNSIYIKHPEGYTSVYAHLDSFNPIIDSLITEHQYAQNSFTVDITTFKNPITVESGEFIAIMGNTGRSFGPHLHFEIRETTTDKLINPFLMGIKPADNRSPIIKYVELKVADANNLPYKNNLLTLKNTSNSKSDKKFDLGKIEVNSQNQYDLSIALFDQMNGSSNKNGIYSIEWMQHDSTIQEICLNKMEFEDSDNIYEIMDLQKKLGSNEINYLFNLNRLHSFSFVENDKSSINSKKEIENYKIIFSDFEGNQTSVTYQLKKISNSTIQLSPTFKPNYILPANKQALIQTKNFDIFIPNQQNAKQQGIYIDEITNNKSVALVLAPNNVPFSNKVEIRCNLNINQDKILSWLSSNDKGERVVIDTCHKSNVCQIAMTELKNLSLEIDSIPPTITLLRQQHTLGKPIKFQITDNFKPDNKNLYLNYEVIINNKWCLFNYDLKNDMIVSANNNYLVKGLNNLSVVVTDSAGNENCSNFQIEIK